VADTISLLVIWLSYPKRKCYEDKHVRDDDDGGKSFNFMMDMVIKT